MDRKLLSQAVSLQPEEMLPESLRIGLFSESFSPVRNGVTSSLNTLIGGLRSAGHRVWVCAPAHDAQAQQETNVLRFPSFVTAYNREYPLAYPFYPALALSTHFNRLRLDIVHTHTPFVLGLTGAKLAITRGTPLISTFHTLYSSYTHYVPVIPEAMSNGLLDVYLPWYYNRCSHVICPSQTARNILVNMGVESPISIIPTGIPLPAANCIDRATRDDVRSSYGWSEGVPILLFAGRLANEKNVIWLFSVLQRVRRKLPDAILAIVGDGPDRNEIEEAARELPIDESAIQFLGAVPRDLMDRIYAAADVFCFPSGSETQGLVVSEARAAGTPSVVINKGGAPETVEEGIDGFLVPEGDAEQFADRVVELVNSPDLLQEMQMNCKRRAELFTPERMIQQILKVYETERHQAPKVKSLVPPTDGKGHYWNIFSPR